MCTNFQIQAKDGSWIIGRTMEFGANLNSEFYVHRRGDSLNLSTFASREFAELPSLTPWSARYGYAGLNSFNIPATVDGINEAGLSVGALWLPGTTYQKVTDKARAIPAPLLCDWVLAHCATVDEVIEQLPSYQFWLPAALAARLPLHFPITDAKGNSIVVEFQNGELQIHKNPVGVCTNAPWFPWHLANLGNYTSLSPNDPNAITLGQINVTSPGHGGGLNGLPGNATPPSRFVRTAYLKQFANQASDGNSAMVLATHLLNDVDIPQGCVRDGKSQDYTQWSVIKDLERKIFAVRTYDSMVYRAIDLKQIDFTNIKSHCFPVPAASDIKFVTVQTTKSTTTTETA